MTDMEYNFFFALLFVERAEKLYFEWTGEILKTFTSFPPYLRNWYDMGGIGERLFMRL